MRAQRVVLVGLIIAAVLIPTVSASLLSTSTSIRVYQRSGNVRIYVKRSAPYFFDVGRPTRSFKWTLYRQDVYGRYLVYRTGYTALGSWKLNVWSLKVSASKSLYQIPGPGKFKVRVWFAENCYYRGARVTKYFTVNP